jgi:hypothetical protein
MIPCYEHSAVEIAGLTDGRVVPDAPLNQFSNSSLLRARIFRSSIPNDDRRLSRSEFKYSELRVRNHHSTAVSVLRENTTARLKWHFNHYVV